MGQSKPSISERGQSNLLLRENGRMTGAWEYQKLLHSTPNIWQGFVILVVAYCSSGRPYYNKPGISVADYFKHVINIKIGRCAIDRLD